MHALALTDVAFQLGLSLTTHRPGRQGCDLWFSGRGVLPPSRHSAVATDLCVIGIALCAVQVVNEHRPLSRKFVAEPAHRAPPAHHNDGAKNISDAGRVVPLLPSRPWAGRLPSHFGFVRLPLPSRHLLNLVLQA